MSEARLGMQFVVDDRMMSMPKEYFLHERTSLDRKLGAEIVDYLRQQTTPTVLRYHESGPDRNYVSPWIGKSVYKFFVDFTPVQVERIKMLELPPFQFTTTPLGVGVPMIEWQCAYCGMVNEIAKHLECRKCGAPRRVLR